MPLKLYKRGKIWHYRGTVAGQLLRGSAKTASKETAQRIAAGIEGRAWKGHLDPQADLTFADAAMLYRNAEKSDRFLRKIEDHWRNTPVKDMTPGAIRSAAMSSRKPCAFDRSKASAEFTSARWICDPTCTGRSPVLTTTRVRRSRSSFRWRSG